MPFYIYFCIVLQPMALNQTDSHSGPVLTLTSTLKGPRTIEITHLFSYTTPRIAQDLSKSSPMIPIFNHDLRHFTPAFILPSDQNYYNYNEQFESQKFLQRSKKIVGQLSNSNIEVVSPTQNYCQICKQQYDFYMTHILSTAHHKKLKLSKAHTFIQEICSLYPQLRLPQKTSKKRANEKRQEANKSSRARKKSQPAASKKKQVQKDKSLKRQKIPKVNRYLRKL